MHELTVMQTQIIIGILQPSQSFNSHSLCGVI